MSDSESTERNARLVRVELDDSTLVHWTPELAHERRLAVFDLVESNHFAPRNAPPGPYAARIALMEERMVFHVTSADNDTPVLRFAVPVGDLRRLVRDYHAICQSYYDAIPLAPVSRIEAIDMGRRAIHEEGADHLAERMGERVDLDRETARRLFTLLSVMSLSGDPGFVA